jgi:hypothetical protein
VSQHAFFGLNQRAFALGQVNQPRRYKGEGQEASPVAEAAHDASLPSFPYKGKTNNDDKNADANFGKMVV